MINPASASQRGPLGRGFRRLAMAGVLIVTFSAGIGAERYVPLGGTDAGAQSSFTELPEFTVLQETWDVLQRDYIAIDEVDNETLMRGAARGMVEAVGDTGHTTYLDPEQARAYEAATRGELIGIGVQLDYSGGRPVVIAPIDGSPADEAGIEPEDVIVAIDGRETAAMTQTEVFQAIRGDEGTTIELTLERPGEAERITVSLERRRITVEPATWTMLPGKIAHIRLSEFSINATDGVREALTAAKAQGAEGIIFDLRNNPGGLVTQAIGVGSQFLEEGKPLYRIQERGSEPSTVPTTGIGEGTELPMVVLINRGSASAAEIVASALQENGRAELVGETTFGTGTVLIPRQLSDGSVLLVGTAFWLTSAGERIWHRGVAPSIEVALDANAQPFRPSEDPNVTVAEFEAMTDNQLRRAHELLVS